MYSPLPTLASTNVGSTSTSRSNCTNPASENFLNEKELASDTLSKHNRALPAPEASEAQKQVDLELPVVKGSLNTSVHSSVPLLENRLAKPRSNRARLGPCLFEPATSSPPVVPYGTAFATLFLNCSIGPRLGSSANHPGEKSGKKEPTDKAAPSGPNSGSDVAKTPTRRSSPGSPRCARPESPLPAFRFRSRHRPTNSASTNLSM